MILHILRRDIRHHWPEIVISLALLGTFAWNEPRTWGGLFDPDVRFLSESLTFLLPVAWALLVLRAVQEESLVGDRQFWVTRPYEWGQLLIAKLGFILIFVSLPLFLADCFLLARAGFHPLAYLNGLVWRQLLWLLFFILPTVVLGAITSNIGQAVLVLLGTLVFVILFGLVALSVPNAGIGRAESIPNSVQLGIALMTAVSVVLLQYARRRTTRARALLLSASALLILVGVAAPYRTLIARSYPGPAFPPPAQFALNPAKPETPARAFPSKDEVWIELPLIVSGIAPDSVLQVDGVHTTIKGSSDLHYDTGWTRYDGRLLPGRPRFRITLQLDKKFFDKAHSTPVNVHLELALSSFRQGQASKVTAAEQFAMPGDGRCIFDPVLAGVITCFFPIKEPFVLLSAASQEITCSPQKEEIPLPSGLTGYGWLGSQNSGPANFGLSPVETSRLVLWDWDAPPNLSRRICPGTPLTLHMPKPGSATRVEAEITGIRLEDYVPRNVYRGADGAIGYSVVLR